MSIANQQILHVLDAYKAAMYAKDVNAFCANYAEDTHVFDMWGEWVYEGLGAWRKMAEGWFASLGDERVVVEFTDVRIAASGEMAVIEAFVSYSGESAQGERLRTCTTASPAHYANHKMAGRSFTSIHHRPPILTQAK